MTMELEQVKESGKEGLLSSDEQKFLQIANNPISRQSLLVRLEKLGLLSAFLEAESGTNQ